MTARPFSTIHLLMDQFKERDFTILFLILYKRGVVLAPILAGFKGFLVQMVAWGMKIVCKKFHEKFTQNKKCIRKTLK